MRFALFSLFLACGSGCLGDRPQVRGGGCELNSQCDEPFVCKLGRCRVECVSHRDCGLGLDCFLGAGGAGGCQLPDELTCSFDADCTERCGADPECSDRLACRDGRCAPICAADRDCAQGATCEPDSTGTPRCVVTVRELCVYNSDCPAPYVCDDDQICRLECVESIDCIAPRQCVSNYCVLPDGGP